MTVDTWYAIRAAKTHNQRARLARAVLSARLQGAKWPQIEKAAGLSASTIRRRINV